jgi:hypothetical protein
VRSNATRVERAWTRSSAYACGPRLDWSQAWIKTYQERSCNAVREGNRPSKENCMLAHA